jgi:hypothetical protein
MKMKLVIEKKLPSIFIASAVMIATTLLFTAKGTNTAISMGMNGNYTIAVPSSSNILVFTSVGFATQEYTVGNLNPNLEQNPEWQ